MGGIIGADAICAASGNAPAGYTTYRALLGSPAGAINAFPVPAGVPVQSLTSQVIASNWATMLSGTLLQSLQTAGVITGNIWWSGSESGGGYTPTLTSDCNAWADGSSGAWGNYGDATATDGTWVISSNSACDMNHSLICVAY
jgi:hypothetical protein